MYMIYNPEANHPRVVHKSLNTLVAEAERLARLHPGQKFYIMEARGYYSVAKPPVTYTPVGEATTYIATPQQPAQISLF